MKLFPWTRPLVARFRPPGDKSITHRAVLFSTLAEGDSEIYHPLDSLDIAASLRLVQTIGVEIIQQHTDAWVLRSPGYHQLHEPDDVINCDNSGTTIRLASGLLAGLPGLTVLTGDNSLRRRPMARVIEPLTRLGVDIRGRTGGLAPLVIKGGAHRGGVIALSVASAQVKSAVLLAGMTASQPVTVQEKTPTRDHTERFLHAMGAKIYADAGKVTVEPGRLQPIAVTVPGDPSSAAFWATLAALLPGSSLVIEKVSVNPGRVGFYQVLQKMGAGVEFRVQQPDPDPMGEIVVASGPLRGISIGPELVPSLIDELPLIGLLGSLAQGKTEVRGAEELRFKESDRIHTTVVNLQTLGVEIKELPDGFEVWGQDHLGGGVVDAFGDHRIGMMLAIAAAVSREPLELLGGDAIAISYPKFFSDYQRLGSV
ncbi:MAG: 3-phosphoshikimate 1-carboxyvinyltransferase [Sulfobacillus benefaciens]|uniref:3-phosphoshikimate 1-carboxyvinyltransferase n=1 Tax=Sulfobacillus benefaciens TaxID=453960 RepID=A0A2T2XJK2_9FIRM|nr:MAG: 3-phosphoshikimate 1-carboxyvinyltransferase [Sulfobacillus benefaciens]